jgi:hypothetical protein
MSNGRSARRSSIAAYRASASSIVSQRFNRSLTGKPSAANRAIASH